MKILSFLFLIVYIAFPQEKEIPSLPKSQIGLSILISESGFGLGTNYGFDIASDVLLFTDFTISEVSDEREFEFIDYWGNKTILGKKNRLFLIPLNFGVQYQLFKDDIVDNFRPFIVGAVGPQTIFYTPYKYEFFSSLKYGKLNYGIGGYIGLGINFGSVNSFQGINIRYNIVHLFGDGIESLEGKSLKNINSFFLSISFGMKF